MLLEVLPTRISMIVTTATAKVFETFSFWYVNNSFLILFHPRSQLENLKLYQGLSTMPCLCFLQLSPLTEFRVLIIVPLAWSHLNLKLSLQLLTVQFLVKYHVPVEASPSLWEITFSFPVFIIVRVYNFFLFTVDVL